LCPIGHKISHSEPYIYANVCFFPAITALPHRGNNFLSHIVACDETWCHFFDSAKKQICTELRHFGSPRQKKTRFSIRARKVMFKCLFFTRMAPWFWNLWKRNANRFCDTLRKLKEAIKNRRSGLLSKVVILYQDNFRHHVADVCKYLMPHLQSEILHHTPYSPELSPCDFHVFGPLKKHWNDAGSHKTMRSEKSLKNFSATKPRLSSVMVSVVSWTNGTLVSTKRGIICRQYMLHSYFLCTTLQIIIYTCI